MNSNASIKKEQEECSGFDYEVLHHCQYEVTARSCNDTFSCDEPATHKVWWANDMSDAMFVCPEHFEVIIKAEDTM